MERNVPKLRFKEFSDEWNKKELKELVIVKGGYAFKSKEFSNSKKKYQIVKMGNVYQNKLLLDRAPSYKENITEKEKEYLLEKGDVIISLTGTVGKHDFGYSYMINEEKNLLLNQRLGLVRAKKSVADSTFIRNILLNKQFLDQFFESSVGGTGNQANVSTKNIEEFKIKVPSLQEQERIANFLTKVDKIIEKQEEKVKNLENYKKGIMQRIFSQEIRFKDENGEEYPEWEEKKLEQCFLERVEKNKPDLELLSVSISDGVKKRSEIESKDNSSDDKSNYKLVEQNDIVYNSMRMWQGASGVSEYKGIVSPAYTVLIPLDNVNSIYFSYLFKLENTINKFRKFSQGLTSDTWNLKYPLLKDIKVIVPCLNEQDKIARFLTRISLIIEEENNKLEELKQWKKGLLQQMFV